MVPNVAMPHKERWTYADYTNLTPPDSFGFQVIRGELVVSPSPKRNHQRTVLSLGRILDAFVSTHRLGEVFVAPFDVVLDAGKAEPENVVQPDLMFVSKDRFDIVTEENIKGAPDLVVEVLSESTARYDRVRKMGVYAEFGVVDYWILDPDAKTFEVFDLTGERPQLKAALAGEDVYRPDLLPGLEIPLDALWYPEKKTADGEDT